MQNDASLQWYKKMLAHNGMRAHLYFAEAMTRVKLDTFLDWLHFQDKYYVHGTVLKSDKVKRIEVLRNSDNLTDIIKSP